MFTKCGLTPLVRISSQPRLRWDSALSRDGGTTWNVQHHGLHAPYCAAIAFVDDAVLVSASEGHFAPRGRLYRKPIDGEAPLIAVVDKAGHVHVSIDSGRSWATWASDLRGPSILHLS